MAFMTPEYWFGRMLYCCDNEGEYYPGDYFDPVDVAAEGDCEEDDVCSEVGWFCRLSASGYSDSTEWSGPYPNHDEARHAIYHLWDVDPEEGIDLEEWEQNEGREYVFRRLNDPRAIEIEDQWRAVDGGTTSAAPSRPRTKIERVTDFFFPPIKDDKDTFLSGLFRAQHRRKRRRR